MCVYRISVCVCVWFRIYVSFANHFFPISFGGSIFFSACVMIVESLWLGSILHSVCIDNKNHIRTAHINEISNLFRINRRRHKKMRARTIAYRRSFRFAYRCFSIFHSSHLSLEKIMYATPTLRAGWNVFFCACFVCWIRLLITGIIFLRIGIGLVSLNQRGIISSDSIDTHAHTNQFIHVRGKEIMCATEDL